MSVKKIFIVCLAFLLSCTLLISTVNACTAIAEASDTEPSNSMTVTSAQYNVGDIVVFGHYSEQEIEWQILEINDDNSCVMITREGIEAIAYNNSPEDVTWETCTLRSWLNSEFYETAFDTDEKALICSTLIKNEHNPDWETKGGNDTEDTVWILSLNESETYFDNNEERLAIASESAIQHGADILSQNTVDKDQSYYPYTLIAGACYWWLRTPGCDHHHAATVDRYGCSYSRGSVAINDSSCCVRPVIRVRLYDALIQK